LITGIGELNKRHPVRIGFLVTTGVPGVGQAGLETSPFDPTYNVGPEAAWMNPAGMTGVKTKAFAAGVGGLIPVSEFDPSIAGAGGGDGGNAGVATVLPSAFMVFPVSDRFRLGVSVLAPVHGELAATPPRATYRARHSATSGSRQRTPKCRFRLWLPETQSGPDGEC